MARGAKQIELWRKAKAKYEAEQKAKAQAAKDTAPKTEAVPVAEEAVVEPAKPKATKKGGKEEAASESAPAAQPGAIPSPANPRKNVKKGDDDVTGTAEPRTGTPGDWSYEELYARAHGGARVSSAGDEDRERRARMKESADYFRKHGKFKSDAREEAKWKARAQAITDKFVAQARAGKFQGNIYLSGQNWEALAAQVDENGNLSETMDMAKNKANMDALNAWAKSVNSNDGSRYGGRYNMSALPKGIFIQDQDGNWKVNEAMITSQAQINALLQMKAQDDSRQGRYKSEQAERQKKVDADNRKFLTDRTAYDPADIEAMSSDQLAAEVGAIRQENIEAGIKEGDEARVKDYGGTATQRNKAAGRPDTQAEFDAEIDWSNPVDFDNLPSGNEPEDIPPAEPKDQSPKTDASPKLTDEEDK